MNLSRSLIKLLTVVGAVAFVSFLPMAATASHKATCNNSNPVKVGALYSLTGPVAEEGKLYSQGAQIAVKDINTNGGVLGRCVVMDLIDDQASPTTAAQGVRQLVQQDNVAWVEGSFLSAL